MGNANVSPGKPGKQINQAIENQLTRDRRMAQTTVRLLLLGSGNSGKSTLAKQMKLLRMDGFTEEERLFFQHHIYVNIIESVMRLYEQIQKHKVPVKFKPTETQRVEKGEEMHRRIRPIHFSEVIAPEIQQFLSDTAVSQVMLTIQELTLELPDSARYYFDQVDRVGRFDYVPSHDDIIRCRIPTTGINELNFEVNRLKFRLIDVGGQQGLRRKWIDHFENMQGMIFVTAISEYDKRMVEDASTNRMHDSLALFQKLANNSYFVKTAILLFFNKKDLFREKIAKIPITVCFPEYGNKSNDYEDVTRYVKERFLQVKPPAKNVYHHFTDATDTENIKHVFNLTFDIVLNANLKQTGLTS